MLASLVQCVGIRPRLLAVILVAVTPFVVLIALEIRSDFRETLAAARAEVRTAAELAVSNQSRAFLESRVFLETLQYTSATMLAGGPGCDPTQELLLEANPQFVRIGIVDQARTSICDRSTVASGLLGETVLFERMAEAGYDGFAVGDLTTGHAATRPTLTLAIRDSSNTGFVFVGYDLEYLLAIGDQDRLTAGATTSMLDSRSGRFVAVDKAGDVRLTDPVPGGALALAIGEGPRSGVADAVGLDGVERILGFAALPGSEGTGFIASVGVSKAETLAPVYARSMKAAATALLVCLLACLATWWLGTRTHVVPIVRLTRMAKRIGIGDLETRAEIAPWQAPEFRRLGTKHNMMTERLQAARAAEQAAAARDAIYRLLAENTADVVVRIDADGTCTFVSPAAREVLGTDPFDMLGSDPTTISIPEDRGVVEEMIATLRSGDRVSDVRFRVRHPVTAAKWVEVTARPLAGGGAVLVVRDITRRVTMEEELKVANRRLEVLAFEDALTGLTNRRAFDVRFDVEFKRAVRDKTDLSLIILDIDRFKNFNDTYGHPAGDECLRLVATAFRHSLNRPGDVGARYGGRSSPRSSPERPWRALPTGRRPSAPPSVC
ncbi:PAS domain S-box-containing protein [Aurantimonas endophytica]|uniref:PAS domain S-box-containing protein n=1 Tax=Aurantimonas endophytica TaxID=1522175 RepID=A0A7W6HGA2_9HYPH|nr:PAS domain S-box-containing protein [Aurantimonas endophytica]MCO6405462.1 diguanylate cyclase [Aurantimonas endophytica]